MISAQQQATLRGANCEVAFDNLTRQLYATDASIYQITPEAVAFPANTQQASLLIDAAVQASITVIPRGAGTGLTGGAVPLTSDCVMVNTERLDRIRSVSEREFVVHGASKTAEDPRLSLCRRAEE